MPDRAKLLNELNDANIKLGIYEFVLNEYPLSAIYIFFQDEVGDIVYALAKGHLIVSAGFKEKDIVGNTLENVFKTIPDEYDILSGHYKAAVKGKDQSMVEHTFAGRRFRQYFRSVESSSKYKYGMLISIDITDMHQTNKAMIKIAWEASHGIRGVFASVLGLINLLDNMVKDEEGSNLKVNDSFKELFELLKRESTKMDEKIHDIVRLAESGEDASEGIIEEF